MDRYEYGSDDIGKIKFFSFGKLNLPKTSTEGDVHYKNKNVEIETSESSSYIAGNYAAYDKIAEIIRMTASANDPISALGFLKQDNNKWLKENIQILGKLGRQGVNVKSYIGSFCTELGRKDLFPLLQAYFFLTGIFRLLK